MAERIVYGQKDLEQALSEGLKTITLCAGIYDLPLAPGVMFDRLGPVRVSVQATRREADDADMLFWDIYPEYRPEYAFDSRVPLWPAYPGSSGSGGSFAGSGGSYSGSYRGSFAGSFGSLAGSYVGSFAGLFGSLAGSHSSWSSSGSFASSGAVSSYHGLFGVPEYIFGYGIDLI